MSGSSAAPLHARTVVVPLHAVPLAEQHFATFAVKDPADILVYKIDVTAFLTDAGTTITGTPSVVSNDASLVISEIASDGLSVTFEASGGVGSHVYGVTLSAALDNGGAFNRTFWLPVAGQFGFVQGPQQVVTIGPAGPASTVQGTDGVGITTIVGAGGNAVFYLSDGSEISIPLVGQGQPGVGVSSVTGAAGQAVFHLSDGSTYDVALPAGPASTVPGPPGRGVSTITSTGSGLVFALSDGTQETVALPTIAGVTASQTFTALDAAFFDSESDQINAALALQPNLTAQNENADFNLCHTESQSRGYILSGPAINLTPKTDSLMWTTYLRWVQYNSSDALYGTLSIMGSDTGLHPLCVPGNQNISSNVVVAPQAFDIVVSGVTIVVSGTNSTLTCTAPSSGPDFSALSAGQTVQFSGFAQGDPSVANNDSRDAFVVHTVNGNPTTTKLVLRDLLAPTTALQNNIRVKLCEAPLLGEDQQFSKDLIYRTLQLAANPTAKPLVYYSTSIAQIMNQKRAPQAWYTPSPAIFVSGTRAAIQGMVAACKNTASGYGAGPGKTVVVANRTLRNAGDDASGGYSYQQAFNIFAGLIADHDAQDRIDTGQTRPCFKWNFAASGVQIATVSTLTPYATGRSVRQGLPFSRNGNCYVCAAPITSTATPPTGTAYNTFYADADGGWNYIGPASADRGAVHMAQLMYAGCAPYLGYDWNDPRLDPDFTCYGPVVGPSRGPHGPNYTYMMEGALEGKVWWIVKVLRRRFLPMHYRRARVRVNQVALIHYLPTGPIRLLPNYLFTDIYNVPDGGYYLYDKNGPLTGPGQTGYTCSTFGRTSILFDFTASGRQPDYATLGVDGGPDFLNGKLGTFDSDSFRHLQKYLGSGPGQAITDDFLAALGAIDQNGMPFHGANACCPFSAPPGTSATYYPDPNAPNPSPGGTGPSASVTYSDNGTIYTDNGITYTA